MAESKDMRRRFQQQKQRWKIATAGDFLSESDSNDIYYVLEVQRREKEQIMKGRQKTM